MKPFIPPEANIAELTPRAALLGAFFGVVFGAVTVYLALKVGLTVSASIPIAVLSIMIFRKLGRSTILENNIVQTIGSAGESIASGVVFTLPALIFLSSPLEYHRIFLIAAAGGLLGVLMMIPLRRALIVKEHETLKYPEGTACANILVAGEKGGALAGKVFAGLAAGALYKTLMSVARFWKEVPAFVSTKVLRGFSLSVEASPELLGVGYIIGFRASCTLVAGGVLSWAVLIPFVKFLGAAIPFAVYPGRVPIAQMDPNQIWGSYIRYIGAGAVAAGGIINITRAMPTIASSFRDSLRALKGTTHGTEQRTDRDLPITVVFVGCALLIVGLFLLINYDFNPGHPIPNAVAALLIVGYGFFFVTVSSRVVGMIGSSNNPISGDTITTLMGTCLLFVMIGWTTQSYAAVALSIGAVVCVAAANAGATSQDLKTGYLVGATPRAQQLALMIGVFASVLIIGVTLKAMNAAYAKVETVAPGITAPADARHDEPIEYRGKTYQSVFLQDGKYLVDDQNRVVFRYIDGIGGRTLAAPQARLMSMVVSGILDQKLPWALVLLGICIGIVVELCGVHALPFAVGVYLPLSTTTPVFFGGLMSLIAGKLRRKAAEHEEASEGTLYSSGLIAGGSLMGVGVAVLILLSGRWQPLGNALETLRRDGIHFATEATIEGHTFKPGDTLAVRTKNMVPSVELGGKWVPFEKLKIEAAGDSVELEFDQEERGRTIHLAPVDTWDIPLRADNLGVGVAEARIEEWKVEDGANVEYDDPIARLQGGIEIKAPQRGRIRERTKDPTAKVHATLAVLETKDGAQSPAIPRQRIVVEPRPGSDLAGLLIFLVLCSLLVWSAVRPVKPA